MNAVNLFELDQMSKSIMYDILKGELSWEDEKVQFFLPLAFAFTNYDWLKYVAENILIEEDCEIVKNFLDHVQSICKVNEESLTASMDKAFKRTGGL